MGAAAPAVRLLAVAVAGTSEEVGAARTGASWANGPPLVVYGSLRRWSPEHFRATLQAYFLPASLLGLCGYWLAGLMVPTVTRYYLLSLPPALVAIMLGRVANRRLTARSFVLYVHVGLLAVGMVLLVQAVWK